MISKRTRLAYSEVDAFLNIISQKNRGKVPKHIREIFENEKDNNYVKNIDPNIPIKNQNLMKETLAIIALLNINYWCETDEAKQKLIDTYKINEQKIREQYRNFF